MPRNGQFWYGPYGFLYKKNNGVGGRKNPSYGLICNQPTFLYNKYISGAGIGSTSVSVRRAKLRLATSCNSTQVCGRFFQILGQNQIRVSQYTNNS